MTDPEQRSLDNTVIVVTGAGGGIGGAIVRTALAQGARVVAGDLSGEALNSLRDQWGPDRLVTATGDLRLAQVCDELVAAGVNAFGRVDSVVANAAVGFYGGILDVPPAQLELMVDVNVKGTVWLARSAVQQVRAQGGDETHENCPRNAVRASRRNARETVSVVVHGKWVVDDVTCRDHGEVRQGLPAGLQEGQGSGAGPGRGSDRLVS